ncbi:hypothetical protein MBLNU457_g0922t1 [Dothideomycetes sp. NU457]
MSAAQGVFASPELMENICDQLSTIDHICCLRSVCRSLEASTLYAFRRRGFSAKSSAFTKPGLQRLLDISQNERFAHELTSVSFCTYRKGFEAMRDAMHLRRRQFIAQGTFDSAEFKEYCNWIDEQQAFHNHEMQGYGRFEVRRELDVSGRTTAPSNTALPPITDILHDSPMRFHHGLDLLERAFSNLARLGNRLEVSIWAEGSMAEGAQAAQDRAFDYARGRTLITKYGQPLFIRPGVRYDVGTEDFLVAVIHAILTTQAVVTKIHAPECAVPDEIMLSKNRSLDSTTFFSNLSSLSLGMRPSRDPSILSMQGRWTRFQEFLARTRLRQLSLHPVDLEHSELNFRDPQMHQHYPCRTRFLANVSCPGLEGISYTERIMHHRGATNQKHLSIFAPFLRNHCATLRKVVISMELENFNSRTTWYGSMIDYSAVSAVGQALAACQHLESLRLEGSGMTVVLNNCNRVFPDGHYSSAWTGTTIPKAHGRRSRRIYIDDILPLTICYDKHRGDGEVEQPTLPEFLQWMSEHTDKDDDDDDSSDEVHDDDDDDEDSDDTTDAFMARNETR